MKTKHEINPDKRAENELDRRISAMIRRNESVNPSTNPWFVSKVINRLPPRRTPLFGPAEIIVALGLFGWLGWTLVEEYRRLVAWSSDENFDFSIMFASLGSIVILTFYMTFTAVRRSL